MTERYHNRRPVSRTNPGVGNLLLVPIVGGLVLLAIFRLIFGF
jgi:hypothetical protein